MTESPMRGVFPILVTPFDNKSRIDEESLRRLIDFNIDSGVHGLGVALGSEVFKLSEAERVQVTRVVVDQVKGRVPVVINTGAAGTGLAVEYSVTAQENGADAVMVIRPSFIPFPDAAVVEYYRSISDAVTIPIFIQDTAAVPVPAGLARRIAEESENVQYIKVESLPTPAKVAAASAQAGHELIIFGGAGGSFFIEEMRRGSSGTMPFCTQPEEFVQIWDLYRSGDEKKARSVFERRILPVKRISTQSPGAHYHVHKEILRQRGVISTAVVRGPATPLDDLTMRELQNVIDELYG